MSDLAYFIADTAIVVGLTIAWRRRVHAARDVESVAPAQRRLKAGRGVQLRPGANAGAFSTNCRPNPQTLGIWQSL
jgi:hypothetical protein